MIPRSTLHSAIAPLVLAAVLAGAAQLAAPAQARAEGSLNVLTWCDHEDPTLLQPLTPASTPSTRPPSATTSWTW